MSTMKTKTEKDETRHFDILTSQTNLTEPIHVIKNVHVKLIKKGKQLI